MSYKKTSPFRASGDTHKQIERPNDDDDDGKEDDDDNDCDDDDDDDDNDDDDGDDDDGDDDDDDVSIDDNDNHDDDDDSDDDGNDNASVKRHSPSVSLTCHAHLTPCSQTEIHFENTPPPLLKYTSTSKIHLNF